MKSTTVKLPAFLASALVNGDTSGLSDQPHTAINGHALLDYVVLYPEEK